MSFGSVPPDALAAAVEKLLAKMDETELAAFYERELSRMPPDVVGPFVEALFETFRERGESSEDVAEGAQTTTELLNTCEPAAIEALLAYARGSPGALKEAMTVFVERRPELVNSLPDTVRAALAERLRQAALGTSA